MFISFEGIDQCGKTTQIRRVAEWFEMDRIRYMIVREPGGTIISESIRSVLLDARRHEMTPMTEFLLFSAARAQLVREKIVPALRAGIIVIADRFLDSTTAYQGYGRGIDIDSIDHVNRLAVDQLTPDITFFLDITVEESLARRDRAGAVADRMENADTAFHERVRHGYQWLAKHHEARFVVLRGNQPEDRVAAEIKANIQARLAAAARKQ